MGRRAGLLWALAWALSVCGEHVRLTNGVSVGPGLLVDVVEEAAFAPLHIPLFSPAQSGARAKGGVVMDAVKELSHKASTSLPTNDHFVVFLKEDSSVLRLALESSLNTAFPPPVAPRTYVVHLPFHTAHHLAASPLVSFVARLPPHAKLAPSLLASLATVHNHHAPTTTNAPLPPPPSPRIEVLLSARHDKAHTRAVGESLRLERGLRVRVGGRRKVVVEGLRSLASLPSLVAELATHGDVLWVAWAPVVEPTNAFATALVAGGTAHTPHSAQWLWDAGVDGDGEVIASADTGLDVDHCFFSDPDSPAVPYALGTTTAPHRKVALYTPYLDGSDGAGGHGTHVVGSLVGSALASANASLPQYSGMAPKARVAFTDIGIVGETTTLQLPPDLEEMFQREYDAGARVFSESWGAPGPDYSTLSQDVDGFLFAHPDTVLLAAVGNAGRGGPSTVYSPATCKNCVGVGASQNSIFSYMEQGYGLEMRISVLDEPVKFVQATFGPVFQPFEDRPVVFADPVLACSPLSNSTNVFAGALVFVDRGECTFTQKVVNCQDAGAVGVLVGDNAPNDSPPVMGGEGAVPITIPSVAIAFAQAEVLRAHVAQVNATVMNASITIGDVPLNHTNLAAFSSQGPTHDYRIKPDIVAPGHHIASALSDGLPHSLNCPSSDDPDIELLVMQGTSMATPIAAAAGALLRQVLRNSSLADALSVDLSLVPGNASGVLVKALLVHSCEPLTGEAEVTGEAVNAAGTPNFLQGFGRVSLASVLVGPVPANSTTVGSLEEEEGNSTVPNANANATVPAAAGWRTLPFDNVTLEDEGGVWHVCVSVEPAAARAVAPTTPEYALRATLVWYDPPSEPSAPQTLVNDLDLVVFDDGGAHHPPNNLERLGVLSGDGDHANTVEQATLVHAPGGWDGGNVSVAVRLHALRAGSAQQFAVVVSGLGARVVDCGGWEAAVEAAGGGGGSAACSGKGALVDGVCRCDVAGTRGSRCQLEGCPNACSGNGDCVNGTTCQCHANFFGEDCSRFLCSGTQTLTDAVGGLLFTNNGTTGVPYGTLCVFDIVPEGMDALAGDVLVLTVEDLAISPTAHRVFVWDTVLDGVPLVDLAARYDASSPTGIAGDSAFVFSATPVSVSFESVGSSPSAHVAVRYHVRSCPNGCSGHGECADALCSCDAGWSGPACQNSRCRSRSVVSATTSAQRAVLPYLPQEGTVAAQYDADMLCEWMFVDRDGGKSISLEVRDLDLESNYDTLRVFQVLGVSALGVANVSQVGTTLTGKRAVEHRTVQSDAVLVRFQSDGAKQASGFTLAVSPSSDSSTPTVSEAESLLWVWVLMGGLVVLGGAMYCAFQRPSTGQGSGTGVGRRWRDAVARLRYRAHRESPQHQVREMESGNAGPEASGQDEREMDEISRANPNPQS